MYIPFISRLLRKLSNILFNAKIPVESFGWVKLGEHDVDIGGNIEYGIWNSSIEERNRFYNHNRWLDRKSSTLRRIAFLVGKGKS